MGVTFSAALLFRAAALISVGAFIFFDGRAASGGQSQGASFYRDRLSGRCESQVEAIMLSMRAASASIANGLVSTCIPGCR